MKRTAICIAAALVAALAAGAMAGCSSQPASSASASSSSAAAASSESAATASESAAAVSEAASSAAEEGATTVLSDAEELKDAIAKAPAFKSVTVEEESEAVFEADAADNTADSSASAEASEASASAEASEASTSAEASAEAGTEPQTITSKSIYKFDESGDKIKTSVETEIEDITLKYFTDGDDAVFVTDGPSYSGTAEQFGIASSKGFAAYLTSDIGDLTTMADCASKVEKIESNGLSIYMATLDPQKYIASEDVLVMMAESGDPVKEANLTITFEEDGSIVGIDLVVSYGKGHKTGKHLMLGDYDNTTIDPMPEADRTYEEMEADMKLKLDAFEKQLESEAGADDAAADTAEADVK